MSVVVSSVAVTISEPTVTPSPVQLPLPRPAGPYTSPYAIPSALHPASPVPSMSVTADFVTHQEPCGHRHILQHLTIMQGYHVFMLLIPHSLLHPFIFHQSLPQF